MGQWVVRVNAFDLGSTLVFVTTVVVCRYTKEKFGWDKKRCDQELLPVIRRTNQRREVRMTQ